MTVLVSTSSGKTRRNTIKCNALQISLPANNHVALLFGTDAAGVDSVQKSEFSTKLAPGVQRFPLPSSEAIQRK
jgi:hypothetical protein